MAKRNITNQYKAWREELFKIGKKFQTEDGRILQVEEHKSGNVGFSINGDRRGELTWIFPVRALTTEHPGSIIISSSSQGRDSQTVILRRM